MKKIMIICIALAAILFNGCSAMDENYGLTKASYELGRSVVGITDINSSTLKSIDEIAKSYDEVRTDIRGYQNGN